MKFTVLLLASSVTLDSVVGLAVRAPDADPAGILNEAPHYDVGPLAGHDLEGRDLLDGWVHKLTFVGNMAQKLFVVGGSYLTLRWTIDSCKEAVNDEDGSVTKCGAEVFMTFLAALAVGTAGLEAVTYYQNNPETFDMQSWKDFALHYGGKLKGLPNFLGAGPFIGRRPNIQTRGLQHAMRQIEDTMSAHLEGEVRHIGFWDGPGGGGGGDDDEETLEKRGEGGGFPVFGVTRGGLDMHISYSRDPRTNDTVAHVGFGPGMDPDSGHPAVVPRHLLRARRGDDFPDNKNNNNNNNNNKRAGVAPRYNGAYFDKGGLVGFTRAQPTEGPDITPEDLRRMLFPQVYCTLDGWHKSGQDAEMQGFWWQVYDDTDQLTRASGAISTFAPGAERAPLEFMTYEAGLVRDTVCASATWNMVPS